MDERIRVAVRPEIHAVMKETVSSNFYNDVKNIIINARDKVYHYANSTMIYAYWDIGERILVEEQGGKNRADYGICAYNFHRRQSIFIG